MAFRGAAIEKARANVGGGVQLANADAVEDATRKRKKGFFKKMFFRRGAVIQEKNLPQLDQNRKDGTPRLTFDEVPDTFPDITEYEPSVDEEEEEEHEDKESSVPEDKESSVDKGVVGTIRQALRGLSFDEVSYDVPDDVPDALIEPQKSVAATRQLDQLPYSELHNEASEAQVTTYNIEDSSSEFDRGAPGITRHDEEPYLFALDPGQYVDPGTSYDVDDELGVGEQIDIVQVSSAPEVDDELCFGEQIEAVHVSKAQEQPIVPKAQEQPIVLREDSMVRVSL